jgi:hypothetical protein
MTAHLTRGLAPVSLRQPSAPELSPALAQLLDLMFPGVHEISTRPAPAGYRLAHSFVTLPLSSSPRLLLPSGRGRSLVTATSFRQRNEGQHGIGSRVTRAAAALGLRSGLVQRSVGLPSLDVWLPENGERDSLVEHLSAVLNQPLFVGASVRPRDVHQTQVLHALSAAGTVVGFVKISWNPMTDQLLTGEATALQSWKHSDNRLVRPPKVLYFGEWCGRKILVTEPLQTPARNTSSRIAPPELGTALDVAASGPQLRAPLVETVYWARTRRRVEAVCASSLPEFAALKPLLSRLVTHFESDWNHVAIDVAGWHGDWLPWNFVRAENGQLLVWDWEYATDCAPLGFDLLHFFYGTAFYARGDGGAEALHEAAASAGPLLNRLDIPHEVRPLVVALYNLEILLRRLEIVLGGGGVDDPRVFPSIPRLLEKHLDRYERQQPTLVTAGSRFPADREDQVNVLSQTVGNRRNDLA